MENDFNVHKNIGQKKLLDFNDNMIYSNYKTDVIFRNGYGKNSPQIKCKCKIRVGQGREEWGAEKRKRILYFRNIRGD